MFICNECKGTFEELKAINSNSVHFGTPASEESGVCPFCGSDDYEFAQACIQCETYYPTDGLPGYCEQCIKEAERLYIPTLGRMFVDSTEDNQRGFYFIGYWEFKGSFPEHRRKELIYHTKQLEEYKKYEEEYLKEYCLQDPSIWAEFVFNYSEGSRSSDNSIKIERKAG